MSATPVIGIIGETAVDTRPCADAIDRNGGKVELIFPSTKISFDDILNAVNGLLFTGFGSIRLGGRVEEESMAGLARVTPCRNNEEEALLKAAMDRDLPVLGICKGMQVLNVAMGGGLLHSVRGHALVQGKGNSHTLYHRIYIAPGSKLAAVVGSGGFVRVNSSHQQGVKEAQKATSLLASAYSLEDGVIEALESPEHDWVIGVQFHPEIRKEVPPHFERLFQGLVERAFMTLER